MQTRAAVERLTGQLPLKPRQAALPPALAAVHRAVLRSLVERGRPLTRDEIAAMLPDHDVDAALVRLGGDDLLVLAAGSREVVGAYPVTSEPTPHQVTVHGHTIHAMCALDAVSVAPMFGADTVIESRCHVTGTPIRIRQSGDRLLAVEPADDVQVGVRWQSPTGVAAHSMCLEMVFLADRATGEQWQGGDTDSISLFTVPEAIAFGAAFFLPLLGD